LIELEARLEMIAHSENPFPGLRPFEPDEHYLFFGREGQNEELVARLERNRFVAVVGTSGSGKSSLVRAGLLPALYGGSMASAGSYWKIAMFRPGDNPTANLALALSAPELFGTSSTETASGAFIDIETTLRRSSLGLIEVIRLARMPSHQNLLVVVDQFEELFRLRQTSATMNQQDEAAAFVKVLLQAIQQRELPIYVVLTMRSDYLGECAQFRDLPEAINKSQYLIPRMTDDERRQAITGPVAVSEGKISSLLVNRLLNDAGDNPDQLPILQHALMRTWDLWEQTRGDSEPLDVSHYEQVGGMANALSLDADKAYEGLSESRQKIAEKLFKCLTERGPDNQEIRRPTTVKEICEVAGASDSEVIAVIEAFRSERRCFLMTADNSALTAHTRIDISHESLMRGWGRLKEWVEDEHQSARQYRKLADGSVECAQKRGELLTGPALQIALDWRDRQKPNKEWAERYGSEFDNAMAFLDESKEAREAAIAERERRQREMLDQKQRLADIERQQAEERATQAQALAEQKQRMAEIERQQAEERATQAQALADQKAKSVRRLWALVAAMVVLFLLAIGTAGFAWKQWTRASEQKVIADGLRIEAENQRGTAETAKIEAENQRGVAETAKIEAEEKNIELDKSLHDLNVAKQEADNEHKRAEAASQEAIQRLGKLYGAAFEYVVGGIYGPGEENPDKTVENLDEIRKIYRQAKVKSGQITTLALMMEIGRSAASSAAKQLEWNQELLSLLENESKEQRRGTLLRIGDLYNSSEVKEERQKAVPYYEQVLSLGGPSPSADLSVRFKLNETYALSDDIRVKQKAIENYEDYVHNLREEATKEPAKAGVAGSNIEDTLIRLAAVYENIGDSAKATDYLNQAIASRRDRTATADKTALLDTSGSFLSMSVRLFALDDKRNAEEFFDKAVEEYTQYYKKTKAEAARSLSQTMLYGVFGGDTRRFIWYCNQALKFARQLNDTKILGSLFSDIGARNLSLGKYDDAINAFKEELSIREQSGDNKTRAILLMEIGDILRRDKKYTEALQYMNQALEVFKSLDDVDGQNRAKALIKNIEDAPKKGPQ
jgi:energy-coupling factor transporter ATP-binding protein EcfA2